MKLSHFAGLFLVAIFVLSACNLPSNAQPTEDFNAASTAAAQTVQVQLTLAAPLATATSSIVLPTNTSPAPTLAPPTSAPPTRIPASPTSNCNVAQFVADVTIPDGTVMTPDQAFTKTWRLKNSGTCSWTPAYAIVFSSGNAMNGPATQALSGNINPGQTVDISVNFTAPSTPGDYTANYRLRDASGVLFSQFYAQIKVQKNGGAFAVTSVSFSTTGSCGDFTATANITVNGPGNVTYHWVRSDGATDNTVHAPLVFTAAGTQSVSQDWDTTASGAKWIDVYIDGPNHQQFGRASFSCP